MPEEIRLAIEPYQRMIALAPQERVPRHRLARILLRTGQIEAASQAIRDAEENIGTDPVLSRYKVQAAIQRAESTEGILVEDRRAMLLEAQRLALQGIDKVGNSKYSYQVYGDVGVAMLEKHQDSTILDDAISQLEAASELLLDPDLGNALRGLRRVRQHQFRRRGAS